MARVEPQSDVERFREETMANGYAAIAVLTGEKRPKNNGWQRGEGRDKLIPARNDALNTGVCASKLFVLDADVDNPEMATAVRRLAESIFGPTIVRRRKDSTRIMLVYRAATGKPGKKSILGANGNKIECLGDGQQFVAHGIHPNGAAYEWEGDRGPHNTPRTDLPPASDEQAARFLLEVTPLIGAGGKTPRAERAASRTSALSPLPEHLDRIFPAHKRPDLNAAATANMPRRFAHRFEDLEPEAQNALLEDLVSSGALNPLADAPRDVWLPILFGFADAERKGATKARSFALTWCKTSSRFLSEANFDRDWNSFK